MLDNDREMLEQTLSRFEAMFDPEIGLVWQSKGALHTTYDSLLFALALLERGEEEDVERAVSIIRQVLSDQNTVECSHRFGNFRRIHEHPAIYLLAVCFCTSHLTEILLRQGDRLPIDVNREVHRSIAMALVETAALDIPWQYTNATLHAMTNLILGGELLGPEYRHFAELGYQKFHQWVEKSNGNGIPYEYNSPTYCAVDIDVLARLATYCSSSQVATMARIMEERIWIHLAMRYHPGTRKLAGPYSRAYPSVCGLPMGVYPLFYEATGDESILRSSPHIKRGPAGPAQPRYRGVEQRTPDYLRRLIVDKPLPYYVQESVDRGAGNDITTYVTPEYALGTSAKTYQADGREWGFNSYNSRGLMLHYRRRGHPSGFGVLSSLYVINDRRISEYYHEIASGKAAGFVGGDQNQDERGHIRTVQLRNKAIVLYHPPMLDEDIFSLRTEISVFDRSAIKEIYINHEAVHALPATLGAADVVFLHDGETYIALLPLEPSNLNERASSPLELTEDANGHLLFSIYNYRGPKRAFWEYRWTRPFFHSNFKAGFGIEVGHSAEFPCFELFRRHILDETRVADTTSGDHVRQVVFTSGRDTLSIRTDLKTNNLLERAINGVLYSPPMLEADTVKQDNNGKIEVKGTTLLTDPRPALLLVDEDIPCYVAICASSEGGPLELTTPHGSVECPDFGFGKIVYQPGEASSHLEILATRPLSPFYFTNRPGQTTVVINGRDVSSQTRTAPLSVRSVFSPPPTGWNYSMRRSLHSSKGQS